MPYLQISRFSEDKKIQRLGKLDSLEQLEEIDFPGEDVRLHLYDGKPKTPTLRCLLIDIDGLPYDFKEEVDAVVEEYIPYQTDILFTGRGYHIIVELDTPYSYKDRPSLIHSYHKLCDEIEFELKDATERLDFTVDKGAFTACYSRVPGSINTKHGVKVIHCGGDNADRLPNVYELLTYKEVEHKEVILDVEGDDTISLEETELYKNCNFTRYVCEHVDEVDYATWSTVALTLKVRKEERALKEYLLLSTKYKEKVKDDFENFKKNDKPYHYSCDSINNSRTYKKMGSCKGCHHNVSGNLLINVRGRLPTPNFNVGFHKVLKSGEVVNASIEPESVVNHLINTTENLVRIQDRLYYYRDGIFTKETDNIKDFGALSQYFQKKIISIPNFGVFRSEDRQAIGNSMYTSPAFVRLNQEELDHEDYIGFSNGVLNIKTGKFVEHSPKYKLTSLIQCDYDEDESFKDIQDMYESVLYDDDAVKLLRIFAGLTISNIPNEQTQCLLWASGRPDSGKSTFAQLLGRMVGISNVIPYSNTSKWTVPGQGFHVDYTGKKLFVIDDLKTKSFDSIRKESFISFLNPLVSGAMQQVKIPYLPVFEAIPKCTVVITSNVTPLKTSETEGFTRRVRTVHFEAALDKRFFPLIQSLTEREESRSRFIRFAVEGLRDYITITDNGKRKIPRTEYEEDFFTHHHNEAASLHKFLKENLVKSRGSSLPISDIMLAISSESFEDIEDDETMKRQVLQWLSDEYKVPSWRLISNGKLQGFKLKE